MKIEGTKGANELVGALKEANEIWGKAGDDFIGGGKLEDLLRGGKDADKVVGGSGNDNVFGDSGDDSVYGQVGQDAVRGGEGNDFVSGGKNEDTVTGGRGDDVVHGNTGDDIVLGGSGNDQVWGDAGNDWLDGGRGDDIVYGGSGDDVVLVSSGNDSYSGGSGSDTLDFTRVLGNVSVDLSKNTATFGSGKKFTTDKVTGFEVVAGNDGNGHYQGADKTSTWFIGGKGDDWFRGKGGNDTLTGGAGSDTFAYLKKDTAGGAVDTITDFKVGEDHLDLKDFLKGHTSYEQSVRFVADGANTTVQGLVNHQWVDVVQLQGVDSHDAGYSILA